MGLLESTIGAMIGRRIGASGDAAPAAPVGASPYGPLVTALIGLLAAKAMTGGFGDLGNSMGGQGQGQQPASPTGPAQSGAGGLLSGLGALLNRFQQNGQGNLVNSWISPGQNAPATPNQISQALGSDTVRELAGCVGLPEDQVASQLSHELPHVVDRLTPQGRLPTAQEAAAWHGE